MTACRRSGRSFPENIPIAIRFTIRLLSSFSGQAWKFSGISMQQLRYLMCSRSCLWQDAFPLLC